jgi:trans-2,3-dihydro-3-hydroxyanthranilate isomerase
VLPSERASARVRIFTPNYEMPFAGHPTLGTAHVVRALRGGDSLSLELSAGIVPVTARGDRWTLRTAKSPTTRVPTASRSELASMLSLPTSAIDGDPLWVDTGTLQLVIPLASADDVRAARPVPELLAKHGHRDDRESMAYVVTREGDHLLVRFFFSQSGAIVEDPATGSACANLGGYFLATGRGLPFTETVHQGAQCQRPSHLGLHIDASRAIYVTGAVIELGSGTFEI